jgi:signal transduction histidine kinase/CHASE3 domain sensor protein
MRLKEKKFKSPVFHKIIFTISLFILLFIGAISFRHIINTSQSFKSLMHSYEVKLELEQLFSSIKDSENSMRGYLISNDTLYLKPYRNATANVNHNFAVLKNLTTDNIEQHNNLAELFKIVNLRNNLISDYTNPKFTVNYNKDKIFQENFRESSILLAKIRTTLNEMVEIENRFLENRNVRYHSNIVLTPIFTVVTLFITLSLLIYVYYQTTKDVEKLQLSNLHLSKSQFLSYQAEILSDFGTWEWNLETDEVKYSDNLFRILGLEPQSFKENERFTDYVVAEDRALMEKLSERILNGEELNSYYFRVNHPTKGIKHLRASGKRFVDNFGNKMVLGVTQDITIEHSKSELLKSNYNDLIQVNNELNIFDESSRQAEILGKYGSWILNYNTLKYSYSDNLFRLLGCKPQSFEPTIQKLLEFVYPEDASIVTKSNILALSTQEIPTMNYRIIRSDGIIRHFKTISKTFTDLSGIQTMIGTTQDVTEDFNKSEQLLERNKELEQNINELNEFNHVASHDLQEPLRKIQTFVSRLNEKEEENLTEFGREYLTRIEKASDRMRILINDLLHYSRTNRTDKNLVKVDLNEALQNSLMELSQNIEDKNAVITNTKLPSIKGISFQMQQLFSNLLSNSLKYCEEDIVPQIDIDCQEVVAKNEVDLKQKTNKKYYKINFIDNGIGFEQQHAERIFLLFNRLHGKTEYYGTGVGLAICKKIIENHNGFIFAFSQPRVGTTFTIYLPA